MKLFTFFEKLYKRYKGDDVSSLGAEFAYYLILAFFPFLIFLANLATYTDLVGERALLQLSGILPEEAYKVVSSTMSEILNGNRPNILSISMIAALWAASNGFMAITRGLNKAYDVEETRKFWVLRALSVVFTLMIVFSIILAIIMLVFGEFILDKLSSLLQLPTSTVVAGHLLRFLVPMGTIFIVFSLLYYFIPNRKLAFLEVLPGALFSTLFWVASSLLFSFYVSNFGNYSKTYGSLGGVIILLLWLYLTSLVLLVGSEVNATLSLDMKGKKK